jgi:phosphoglycerate dehydrogenase-like enzyme
MKIAVIHDYADVFRTTRAYQRLQGYDVVVHTDAYTEPARVVEQVAGCEAVLLTQQRVPVTREIVARLPDLRFISQTSANVYHIDVAACTEHGVVVSAGRGGARTAYSTTAELTWGLIIASLRHLPFEVERLKQGYWHSTAGTRLEGQTLGIYAFGHIGAAVARVGRAFGMRVVCWGREGSTARARAEGFEIAASREAFFAEADVLSLHSDLHFDAVETPEASTVRIAETKRLARERGRAVQVWTPVGVVCRPTGKEADDYLQYVVEHADLGAIGYLADMHAKDGRPQRDPQRVIHSAHNPLARRVLARGSYCVVGDPDAVAGEFSRLHAAGLDGLAINFVDYLGELPYFAAEVLPRLERLGVRRAGDASREPAR